MIEIRLDLGASPALLEVLERIASVLNQIACVPLADDAPDPASQPLAPMASSTAQAVPAGFAGFVVPPQLPPAQQVPDPLAPAAFPVRTRRPNWTEEEKAILRAEKALGRTNSEIAAKLGRSQDATAFQAYQLGIKLPKAAKRDMDTSTEPVRASKEAIWQWGTMRGVTGKFDIDAINVKAEALGHPGFILVSG